MTMRNTARVKPSSTQRSANKRRAIGSANRRRVSRKANGQRAPGEIRKRSTNEDKFRHFAYTTTPNGSDPVQEGTAIAEESTFATERGYFATAKAVRDFNMKLIEISQANAMATLNFAQEVAAARRPSEAAVLWFSLARKRFEVLTEQSRQLITLAQRVLVSTAEPLRHSFSQTLQESSLSLPALSFRASKR